MLLLHGESYPGRDGNAVDFDFDGLRSADRGCGASRILICWRPLEEAGACPAKRTGASIPPTSTRTGRRRRVRRSGESGP